MFITSPGNVAIYKCLIAQVKGKKINISNKILHVIHTKLIMKSNSNGIFKYILKTYFTSIHGKISTSIKSAKEK